MTPVQTTLVVLLIVTTIIIIVLGVLLARLITNLTMLSQNVDTVVKSVQTEIEPTLKELRGAAQSVNSIASNADKQITGVQNAFKGFFGATGILGSKVKGLASGLVKGIAFGINLFRKK